MDFNAKEMREAALIKKGQYRFRVLDAREKRTSSGNDMLILKLHLFTQGKPVQYWTNLFLTPKMFWQIEHFCYSTGMPEKIDEGRIMAQDCFDKEGIIEIDHRINKETGVVEEVTKDFIYEKVEQPANIEPLPFEDDIPSFT